MRTFFLSLNDPGAVKPAIQITSPWCYHRQALVQIDDDAIVGTWQSPPDWPGEEDTPSESRH